MYKILFSLFISLSTTFLFASGTTEWKELSTDESTTEVTTEENNDDVNDDDSTNENNDQEEETDNNQTFSEPKESESNEPFILTTTGKYGNIALSGWNGLTASNYSASSTYPMDTAEAAFDGYDASKQYNAHSKGKVNRGVWLTANNETPAWIQVKFENQPTIGSFRIISNDFLYRIINNFDIETSNDGVNWTTAQNYEIPSQYALEQLHDVYYLLDSPVTTKYFRIKINSHYGGDYIAINELEIYPAQ